jgi:hypothetical protein
LEFYRDEKNKEISEVRHCLGYLHRFGLASLKERMQFDLKLVWKALNIVAKILGYESEFLQISKLHLPENILLQHLFTAAKLFNCQAYRSYQVACRWNGKMESYLILLEGVV